MTYNHSKISVEENRLLRHIIISLRRCLACDAWMRSTGTDHRICNECKGLHEHGNRNWAEKVAYWRGGQRVLDNADIVR
jgi:hypothetical protein